MTNFFNLLTIVLGVISTMTIIRHFIQFSNMSAFEQAICRIPKWPYLVFVFTSCWWLAKLM